MEFDICIAEMELLSGDVVKLLCVENMVVNMCQHGIETRRCAMP